MTAFRGTYTVMVTPVSADGATLQIEELKRFVHWQIDQGIHGLIPLGSTGEFLSLSDDERGQVAETVIGQAAGRVPVLIGTGAENTLDVIRYSREAEALGADGVMIIPPFYATPTADELFEHFRRVAEAISIPIMVYNNPATANVDLVPPLVARLSEIDNVSYIKESTQEVTRVRDILRLCGDRMTVFGGILGFESFVDGAEGWVAVGSNVPARRSEGLSAYPADDRLRRRALLRRRHQGPARADGIPGGTAPAAAPGPGPGPAHGRPVPGPGSGTEAHRGSASCLTSI
jgi:4-hydroxy-tetrahydrodipicolinate synthase